MAIVRSVFDRKRKYVESRQATRLQHELEDISIKLRKVQYATGCTTSTLNKVLLALAPHLKANVHRFKVQRGDNHMCAQSGATVLELNGCVGCHLHVYMPTSRRMTCPRCRHPRFNVSHHPNEVSFYLIFFIFPLFVCFVLLMTVSPRCVGISR